MAELVTLPDEHVDGGDAHVAVDRLPRLDEAIQLAVRQRTAIVDLQPTLQVAAPYLFQRLGVVATTGAAEARCRTHRLVARRDDGLAAAGTATGAVRDASTASAAAYLQTAGRQGSAALSTALAAPHLYFRLCEATHEVSDVPTRKVEVEVFRCTEAILAECLFTTTPMWMTAGL